MSNNTVFLKIEYVSAEKIENVINQSILIGQSFVYGDSFQSYLVAIVVPDEEPVRAWATTSSNIADAATLPFTELCNSNVLKDKILSEVRRTSELNGLHGFETVRDVFLEPDIFNVANDLITPTFKLKRPQLKNYYSKQIEEMYATSPTSKL